MARSLSGTYRTALVTGAGSGLGEAFARMLAAEGVRVWGSSRPKTLASGAGRIPPGVAAVALDLADPKGAQEAFARAQAEAGGCFDLVVNNAGYGVFGEFAAADFGSWEADLAATLLTAAGIAHSAYRAMRARDRGTLVNVSSLAAEFPLPYMSGYNVAKAGLSALSASLAFESRQGAVKVIDFRPGDYRTAFNETMKTRSTSFSSTLSGELGAAWRVLERNMAAAPHPSRAASDLRRALLRGRSGVVRSGSLFQARLAPALARIAPAWLVRAAAARYFGAR